MEESRRLGCWLSVRAGLVFATLALLATPARADEHHTLSPLKDPPVAALPTDCVDVARTATIGGAKIAVLHDCDERASRTASVAIGSRAGWFVAFVTSIAHQGKDALEISLGGESLAAGTLADGRAVAIYRVLPTYDDRADRSHYVESHVLVCTLPGASIVPACAHAAETCPASGCGAMTFHRGVLAMRDIKGRIAKHVFE